MSFVAAILARLWTHSESEELGWPEKIGMIMIAVLILRAVIHAGVR